MRTQLPGPRALLVPVLGAVLVLVLALVLRESPATPKSAASSPSTVHSGHVTVAISNYAFSPQTLVVRAGTRVTWANADPTAHSATADGGAFDTGTIPPHASRTVTLRRPGTYPYHCVFHAFMTASIKVVG